MTRYWLSLLVVFGMCTVAWASARYEVPLNGKWEMVKVASLDDPVPAEGWRAFEVPGTVSGYKYERAWFRRKFSVPAEWNGKRVLVRFGGVKYNSRLFVNGKHVGGCFNGYDAFELDVADAVVFGADNELRLGVHDWTGIFTGERVDFSRVTGRIRDMPRDRVLGPIGGRVNMYGPWGEVSLRAVPSVYFQRIFVRPSVRRKRLEVDVTVRNSGREALADTIECRVFPWDGSPRDENGQWRTKGVLVASIQAKNVAVAPGRETSVTLRLDDPPLKPWWPHDPNLYVLELRLSRRGSDVLRERVGFREFWIEGPDFYLNGSKIHLLATSWWPPTTALPPEEIASQIKAIKNMNTVCFRTHTQPWRERWYESADELGLLMIPEGAVWNDQDVYRMNDPRFWENYADHLRAMVRHLRNHPSVIMWSLENELWGGRAGNDTPAEHGLARLGLIVKKEDPTRPIMYESDGDPGGVADVIGLHYPIDYFPNGRELPKLWPNGAYWMQEPLPKVHMFWGEQQFTWDRRKPLYIGEYLWTPTAGPAPITLFFGDDAYSDYRRYKALSKAFSWRMQILAYRYFGVSAQSPWTVHEHGPLDERNPCWIAHRDMYRPLAAFIREHDSRFFAGEVVERSISVFNDTMSDQPRVRFRWVLVDGEEEAAIGVKLMDLKSGEHREETIRVPIPEVKERKPMTLRVTLRAGGQERFREEWPVSVYPRPDRKWSLPRTPLCLYDPQGKLQRAWKRARVRFTSLKNIEDWDGRDPLVVGPGALTRRAEEKSVPVIGGKTQAGSFLARRVEAGGRVLLIEQTEAASEWLPVRLGDRASTMTFPQMPSHPVLHGLTGEDFRWWRGDNVVSRHEPVRPVRGGMKPLVVAGTGQGLSHAPLLEVPQGAGMWLVCQLQVVSKLDTEPVARPLIERMVRYLADYAPPAGATYCLAPPALKEELSRLGVDWLSLDDWRVLRRPGAHVLILQTGGDLLARHSAALKSFIESGGQVLWHLPQAEDLELAGLDLPLTVQPFRGPVVRAEGESPWLDALTREDLYWLGRHESVVSWATTPLAHDAVTDIFAPRMEILEGRTFEAEEGGELRGGYVRTTETGVVFASAGEGHWKVEFPETGTYVLGITARGTPVQDGYPVIGVRLDGEPVGMVYVGGREPRVYSLHFEVEAGTHKLTLAFTNDAFQPPEDRNLYVDKFVLSRARGKMPGESLTVPSALVRLPMGKGNLFLNSIRWDQQARNRRKAHRFVCSLLTALGARFGGKKALAAVEAETLTPQPGLPHYRKGTDFVYMGSSGYIEGPVRVAREGRYKVVAWAKGTPAEGQYPIISLSLDGREVGQVECKSDDWEPHAFTVQLPKGDFNLRITFTNDLYSPQGDRNLWLDKLEFLPVVEEK